MDEKMVISLTAVSANLGLIEVIMLLIGRRIMIEFNVTYWKTNSRFGIT